MIDFDSSPIYVNQKVRDFVIRVADLFCIEEDFSFKIERMDNRKGRSTTMSRLSVRPGHKCLLKVGIRYGKVRASTIAHELLHMAGYKHIRKIDGKHNYSHWHYSSDDYEENKTNPRILYDTYSRIIVKDLLGKYEVFL